MHKVLILKITGLFQKICYTDCYYFYFVIIIVIKPVRYLSL